MYKSDVNIKHTNKSHLYWGIDKSSGDVVYIDDVALRGLNCNCKCAACQGDVLLQEKVKRMSTILHINQIMTVYMRMKLRYTFS